MYQTFDKIGSKLLRGEQNKVFASCVVPVVCSSVFPFYPLGSCSHELLVRRWYLTKPLSSLPPVYFRHVKIFDHRTHVSIQESHPKTTFGVQPAVRYRPTTGVVSFLDFLVHAYPLCETQHVVRNL